MKYQALVLLSCIALLALAGCDTLSDSEPAGASVAPESKLRHWGLMDQSAPNGTAARGGADSVGFVVTFTSLVDDPEGASEVLFHGQAIKTRTYYRESFTGVSAMVHHRDLGWVLNDLIRSDSVAHVEPDIPLNPRVNEADYVDLESYRDDGNSTYNADAWYENQLRPWSIERVEAHVSSTLSGDGAGSVDVGVYVLDGPIDHPDLNVVERVSFLPADMVSGSTLHGNHVAGVIAAADDGEGLVGIAPGAPVHALEVLDAAGSSTLSTLLSAVEFVTARKMAQPERPVVANMSIGVDLGTTQLNALDEAVARAVAAGVVFVVSAGNEMADASTYSPAHAPGALVVAASDPYDRFARTFSNHGPEIDLVAPGVDVLSTADGGRYALLTGTSMAAPHVAGGAALYLSAHPTATPAQVLDALRSAADALQTAPRGTTTNRVNVQEF